MDIQSHSGPERSKRAFEQRQNELIDTNRALVRAARNNLSTAARARQAEAQRETPRDAIELSAASREVETPSSAEREARIRELTEAHRMERLHTPERIERAAQRLLEG